MCRNLIQPGPTELTTAAAGPQTEDQRLRYEAEMRKRHLFEACKRGDSERVSKLLEDMSPLDLVDDPDSRMSLLHWASICGHAAVVELLIEAVAAAEERLAFIDLQDAGGCTALYYACQESHRASVFRGQNRHRRQCKSSSVSVRF